MTIKRLLEINNPKDMSIQTKEVGNDRIPLMVVDNFLKRPEEVRQFALSLHYDLPLAGDLWPGYQAVASLHRLEIEEFIFSHYLKPILGLDSENYVFPAVRPGEKADQWSSWFLLTRFGVITMPFDRAPWAKNPHVDYFGFIASVLYLSLPHQSRGGTVFIRHRDTGIETVPPAVRGLPENISRLIKETNSYRIISEQLGGGDHGLGWEEALSEGQVISKEKFNSIFELIMEGNKPTSGYLTESNDVWEITDQVDVKFNRLVLYPTWHLHSVSWDPTWYGESLSERRLTMMNWLNFPLARADG